MRLAHPFCSVVGGDARVLILGSFPSRGSLEAGGYFGHPRNQFWRILGDVLGNPVIGVPVGPSSSDPFAVQNWDYRYAVLRDKEIALWDVVAECDRRGSSADSSIGWWRPNDIADLLERHPQIRGVLLAGQTAGNFFISYWSHFDVDLDRKLRVIVCPSTSPRLAVPYEAKLVAWRRAFAEVLSRS